MLQIIFKRANRRGFTVREYDLEALAENAQYDLFHLQTTVWTTYTRQIENQQVPCSLDTEATISSYIPTIQLEFNKRHFVAHVLFDVCHIVYFVRLP